MKTSLNYYKVYNSVAGHRTFVCSGSYNYCRYHSEKYKRENGYPKMLWINTRTGKEWLR